MLVVYIYNRPPPPSNPYIIVPLTILRHLDLLPYLSLGQTSPPCRLHDDCDPLDRYLLGFLLGRYGCRYGRRDAVLALAVCVCFFVCTLGLLRARIGRIGFVVGRWGYLLFLLRLGWLQRLGLNRLRLEEWLVIFVGIELHKVCLPYLDEL
jgi:hypothetical protein